MVVPRIKLGIVFIKKMGPPRIELGIPPCRGDVLPLDYEPFIEITKQHLKT